MYRKDKLAPDLDTGCRRRQAILFLAAAALALPGRAIADSSPAMRLVDAALAQTAHRVTYDGSYRRIPYPGGDVPVDRGVCSDVVIRAYRTGLDIDLQRLVHEDMARDFAAYPKIWGLSRPDSNIDHRRVPNLATFFARKGARLAAPRDAAVYRPGDLVTWRLPGNLPHIGIVTETHSADGARPLIAHNIGRGPEVSDMLFDYPVAGRFRYLPAV